MCRSCTHARHPRFTFVNVTNRCNVNCPICFDNVPGLGFEFEPPMEYFEKLCEQLAAYDRKPTVCLFGGEPTVREDIFDIIKLAKSHDLKPRPPKALELKERAIENLRSVKDGRGGKGTMVSVFSKGLNDKDMKALGGELHRAAARAAPPQAVRDRAARPAPDYLPAVPARPPRTRDQGPGVDEARPRTAASGRAPDGP